LKIPLDHAGRGTRRKTRRSRGQLRNSWFKKARKTGVGNKQIFFEFRERKGKKRTVSTTSWRGLRTRGPPNVTRSEKKVKGGAGGRARRMLAAPSLQKKA